MLRAVSYLAAGIVIIHGLIHLLGFVAYWLLAEIAELPYKTTLLNGRFPSVKWECACLAYSGEF